MTVTRAPQARPSSPISLPSSCSATATTATVPGPPPAAVIDDTDASTDEALNTDGASPFADRRYVDVIDE